MRPRIKICCIASVEEARLAISAGASVLGLVGEMPSGPGVISDEQIRHIARAAPPGVSTFLLTSRQSATTIIDHVRATCVTTVQIVDTLAHGSYSELREALPNVKLVQVIHVTGPASIAEAVSVAPDVDAILLDSGNPTLAVKELGGTGRRHDWALSRRIRDAVGVPLFLAGGLRPDNVAEAISTVQPYGLDICSGVRTAGHLDPDKLSALVRAVEAACP